VGPLVPADEVAVRTAGGVRRCPLLQVCVTGRDRAVHGATPGKEN